MITAAEIKDIKHEIHKTPPENMAALVEMIVYGLAVLQPFYFDDLGTWRQHSDYCKISFTIHFNNKFSLEVTPQAMLSTDECDSSTCCSSNNITTNIPEEKQNMPEVNYQCVITLQHHTYPVHKSVIKASKCDYDELVDCIAAEFNRMQWHAEKDTVFTKLDLADIKMLIQKWCTKEFPQFTFKWITDTLLNIEGVEADAKAKARGDLVDGKMRIDEKHFAIYQNQYYFIKIMDNKSVLSCAGKFKDQATNIWSLLTNLRDALLNDERHRLVIAKLRMQMESAGHEVVDVPAFLTKPQSQRPPHQAQHQQSQNTVIVGSKSVPQEAGMQPVRFHLQDDCD